MAFTVTHRTTCGTIAASARSPGTVTVAAFILVLMLQGCMLFETREPEFPAGPGGTWLQPDTPTQVVENIRTAIREMNSQTYRNSLSSQFVFEPAANAAQREQGLWSTWGLEEERTYLSNIAAVSLSGHSLQFLEENRTFIGDTRLDLSATYVLFVRHTREGIPNEFQGRLIWEITRHDDGLWYLTRWVDRDVAQHPSWSDLKAAFMK